ncbi:MAG: glycosyltransferase family 4 protein [Proteobacteria bacterium]|jgi:GalNAc-alpha-(1->4)-GalNAc-alpha-(1->3)-diNAcBac-PP-undecaprenol alpha-1,4-N-acetyl-D-galactosaminyltransferase|nr:glycosyltransferase family 4 protein [Pseudomonadota bacterium]
MKIALVIASLQSGGAERVAVNLANGFAMAGDDITLITLSSEKSDFYDLPENVNRVALDRMAASKDLLSALKRNRERVSIIKDTLRTLSPDVTISFCTETNVLVLLAGKRLATKIIVTEHLDPVKASYGRVWEALRRCTYPVADCVVSVSNGVRQGFSWMPANKNRVIYNPISVTEPSDKYDVPAVCDQSKKWITSMGRLENQKGFDVLLDAIEIAREHLKDWQLCIVGDGPLRREIETKIRDSQLGELVVLTGRLKQPHDVIRQSKIFVMASRFEGFPMAHAEALMCGVPVIATDCPSGPSEMIETDVNGMLVPTESPEEIASALLALIDDTALLARLAARAPEIASRLGIKPIVKQWQALFDQL